MKILSLALVLLLWLGGTAAQAQTDTTNVVDPIPKIRKKTVVDWKFITLAGLNAAATAGDIKTTYENFKNCPSGYSCYEANLAQAPFINAGPAASYSTGLAIDVGITYYDYWLKKHGSRWWWAMGAADTGTHVLFMILNSRK